MLKKNHKLQRVMGFVFAGLLSAALLAGCGEEENIGVSNGSSSLGVEEEPYVYILPDGNTMETRIAVPDGYKRTASEEGSIAAFIRNYKMQKDGDKVHMHNGVEKSNQNHHAAVFDMELVSGDLQQCADSVIRIYAEYFWSTEQYDRIAFHFTSGDICSWTKWRDGYRPDVSGRDVSFVKRASYNESYENFVRYLETVFSYAGTLSLDSYEAETISLSEIQIGDVFLKGGSPGHVVMVVDMCETDKGERAFLLAQGYMPAQEFHVIKNPAHEEDPWYYEDEISFPFQTIEYTFDDETMIKRLKY